MTRARALKHRCARLALAMVIMVVLTVVLAAPALAAPAVTTWTVSPKSKILTYGQAVLLSGTLKSEGTAIPGLWVDFGQATTSSGSYQIIYRITTQLATGSARYQVAMIPLQTMYYRFQWAGDVTYAAGDSDVIPVEVMPALGAPGNGTTVTMGNKFSIKGSVTPGAPDGPDVKIKAYRQKGDGSWTGYKTYSTRISGTQYSQSVAITQTGKFKFKAVSVASADFAAGASDFGRVLTVKK